MSALQSAIEDELPACSQQSQLRTSHCKFANWTYLAESLRCTAGLERSCILPLKDPFDCLRLCGRFIRIGGAEGVLEDHESYSKLHLHLLPPAVLLAFWIWSEIAYLLRQRLDLNMRILQPKHQIQN